MISVESHSKQIKLLNQYILALERQVNTAKKELQELQKTSKVSSEDFKRVNDELSRVKSEGEQLKVQNGRLGEQIKRFNGLQKEYFGLREFIEKQLVEKKELIRNLEEATTNNHTLYEHMQELESELATQKALFESQKRKWGEELQNTKGLFNQSQRRSEELNFQLTQEKNNNLLRISTLQGNSNVLMKTKSEEITKLNKRIEEIQQQFTSQINEANSQKQSQNETIKALNGKLVEGKTENQKLQKEIIQLKSAFDKKVGEVILLSSTFNTKIKDYENYVKRTNQQKANLLKNIRSIEEEKKNLETVNASFKGDVNETNRSLTNSLKKNQELTQKLESTQSELTTLKNSKSQTDTLIFNLKKQLESYYHLYDKATREKQQTLERQTQIVRQKMNNQAFYNHQINSRQHEIQRLNKQIEDLNTSLKTKNKSFSNLQQELKEVKLEYNSFKNHSNNLKDNHSFELQSIIAKWKEAERKNSTNEDRIQQLTHQVKSLGIRYQSEKNSLQLSQVQLEKTKNYNLKEQQQTINEYENKLKKKNEQINRLTLQTQQLEKKLKSSEFTTSSLRQQFAKNQKQLQQQVKRLEFERDTYVQKLNTYSLSSMVENQSRTLKQTEINTLRKSLATLQISLKEQKKSIDALTQGQADKQKQIEGLQQSNAALRKQIISSIKNEQASKQELVEIKSKTGSVISGSRVKSSYFQRDSLKSSSHVQHQNKTTKHVRVNEMMGILRTGSGERTFNKKRTAPVQGRVSLVEQYEDMDGSDLENQQTAQQISKVLQ